VVTTTIAPTTTVRPTTTTIVSGETQNPPQGNPNTPGAPILDETGEGGPIITGYATTPLDYFQALYRGGIFWLLLLILIAGYTLWARDTQLMKGAAGSSKGKK